MSHFLCAYVARVFDTSSHRMPTVHMQSYDFRFVGEGKTIHTARLQGLLLEIAELKYVAFLLSEHLLQLQFVSRKYNGKDQPLKKMFLFKHQPSYEKIPQLHPAIQDNFVASDRTRKHQKLLGLVWRPLHTPPSCLVTIP